MSLFVIDELGKGDFFTYFLHYCYSMLAYIDVYLSMHVCINN